MNKYEKIMEEQHTFLKKTSPKDTATHTVSKKKNGKRGKNAMTSVHLPKNNKIIGIFF